MENITGARTWLRRHCKTRVWGLESRCSYQGSELRAAYGHLSPIANGICFVSVGLVVGIIVLVGALCLLGLYFRKPARCKHFKSRVTSLFSVRHNGQFYYSRVSTRFQVRCDILSFHYWYLFHVLLILGLPPYCDNCRVIIILPNTSKLQHKKCFDWPVMKNPNKSWNSQEDCKNECQ